MMRRIVIDTNVFVAALRSRRGASHHLLLQTGQARFELCLSVPLVLEYEDAGQRAASAAGLTMEDVADVIDYLCRIAVRQDIHYLWRPLLPDPKDDHVLELAVAAGCDRIVTHDLRDFAGAERFGIRVLTPRVFLTELGAEP